MKRIQVKFIKNSAKSFWFLGEQKPDPLILDGWQYLPQWGSYPEQASRYNYNANNNSQLLDLG